MGSWDLVFLSFLDGFLGFYMRFDVFGYFCFLVLRGCIGNIWVFISFFVLFSFGSFEFKFFMFFFFKVYRFVIGISVRKGDEVKRKKWGKEVVR